MNRRGDLMLGVVVLALVATDWLTKLWITRAMGLGEIRTVVDGWIHFVHRQNPGVAFSMFADLPDGWRMPLLVGLSLIGVVIFARMVLSSADAVVRVSAAVVLAGALGNLGDRLLNGAVTDFVLVRYFPFVFNFADAAISVGGVVLAARLLFTDEALEPAPATDTR